MTYRRIHTLFALLASLLTAVPAVAQVTPASLTWDYNELTLKTVYVQASGSWTVTLFGSNFIASPKSGAGNGYVSVMVKIPNHNYRDEIGGMVIRGTGFSYTVGFTQKAMPEQGPPRDTEIAGTRVDLQGNWIITRTYTSQGGNYVEDAVFYNGLGYPEQTVKVGASPTDGHNIVTPVVYDRRMREDAMAFLPYVPSTSVLAEEPVSSSVAAQRQWYVQHGPSGDGQYAFSEKEYDGMGRTAATYRPGAAHSRLSGDMPVTYDYDCNAENEVRKLTVDAYGDLIVNGYRPAGAFHKITATDEDGNVTVEFRDSQDNIRLTRRGGAGNWADTYYAYDLSGNLAWVVSPEGSSRLADGTWAFPAESDINTTQAAKYCYVYRNDAHGRRMSEKEPGSAVRYYRYDDMGRVQWSQDGLLRGAGLWTCYFYDSVGRLAGRGVHTYSMTLPDMSACDRLERYTYGSYSGLTGVGFEPVSGIVSGSDAKLDRIAGLKTSETVAVIDSAGIAGEVTRAFYYDEKARLIQTVERWSDGRTSRYSTAYDFVGNPVAMSEKHGTDELRTFRTYDKRGRLVCDSLSVNGVSVTTDRYRYDDLGRPSGAELAANTPAVLERENTYDIQSRICGMEVTEGSTDIFSYTLHFEDAPGDCGRYSGGIGSMEWSRGEVPSSALSFRYDSMDRLTGSEGSSGNAYTEQDITYDRNGNVLSLKRYGADSMTPVVQSAYTYDGSRRTGYGYDAAGNVTHDGTGTARSYSRYTGRLSAAWTGGTSGVSYTRLADGTKTGALVRTAAGSFGVSYEGSFVYILDGSGGRMLESIAFDEGRILGNGTGYVADYHIRDHLGSVRSVVRNGTVIEEDDYYPYGMRQTKAGQLRQTSPVANRYLFSSKEDQSVLFGLCGLDFGAREYDAAGLNWYAPDPLASKYYGLSPYSYCAGNPVKYVDIDGLETHVYDNKNGTYTVIGGVKNLDRNVYVCSATNEYIRDARGHRISIGKTMTLFSFYDFDKDRWNNSCIDINDMSGDRFINDLTNNLRPLGEYMEGAQTNHIYDFKVTNGYYCKVNGSSPMRGMRIHIGSETYIASARDVGNYVAGYYAGANGIPWVAARIAFDYYERISSDGKNKYEGIQTQSSQYIGWDAGRELSLFNQGLNLIKSLPSLKEIVLQWKDL